MEQALVEAPVVEREPKQEVQIATVQVMPRRVWWTGEATTVESERMSYITVARHTAEGEGDKDYGQQALNVPTAELPHIIALLQDLAKR